MNGLVRRTLQSSVVRNLLLSQKNTRLVNGQYKRFLWNMCDRQNEQAFVLAPRKLRNSNFYQCECYSHTKAEKELVEFLAEEIVAEKKSQKFKTIPTDLDGFNVSLDGAEVTLKKTIEDTEIIISFNVNHTVDADAEPELDPVQDKPNIGEMKSKPTFTVDIKRGSETLGFTCSFNNEPGASGADDSYNDIFGIDEVTLYNGEHSDKVYAVAGEIVDGYLYDLLMNYLEEKGISNEFAEKLVELSTNYEHTAYISLLEGLAKFTSRK